MDLFFEIWRPLLQYANQKSGLYPQINLADPNGTDVDKGSEVAKWLWEHLAELDAYLSENPTLPEEHQRVISGWKKCIHHTWFIERHLKNGTVFLGRGRYAFLVKGLCSTIQEMTAFLGMPIAVTATLLPFRGQIVTDGFIGYLPYSLGPGFREILKNQYMEAKRERRLIDHLTDEAWQAEQEPKDEGTAEDAEQEPKDEGTAEEADALLPDDEEDREPDIKAIKRENDRCLSVFEADLKEKGLSDKTVQEHLLNAELFLNQYLLNYEETDLEDGTAFIDNFFIHFYIRKCMWASQSDLKRVCASLKKFYQCMLRHDWIDEEEYEDVLDQIRLGKDVWLEELADFDAGEWYNG